MKKVDLANFEINFEINFELWNFKFTLKRVPELTQPFQEYENGRFS